MPDEIFDNPRLAAIYDAFDGTRKDLDNYLAIVKELQAKSVIDVGCGTGSLASRLTADGYDVIALDPAAASLEIARRKPAAEKVRWIHGYAMDLPKVGADLALMTGNVGQVFLTDESWHATIDAINGALRSGGYFVFEVRDPERKDWQNWTKDKTFERIDVPNIGVVEGWCEVLEVSDELVSFRWTYVFESDRAILTSDSTLRFRCREDIVASLEKSGFSVESIRDAPDRPGKEFVFVCRVG